MTLNEKNIIRVKLPENLSEMTDEQIDEWAREAYAYLTK